MIFLIKKSATHEDNLSSDAKYYNSIYIEDKRRQSMIIDFFEYTIGTNSIDNSYCITAIEVSRGSC